MPDTKEQLEHGKYYHVYNRGINGENIFRENDNYEHFLHLYEKYIDPVAETYAWCLMPNHFHILIRIKEPMDIGLYKPVKTNCPNDIDKLKSMSLTNPSVCVAPEGVDKKIKIPTPDKYFSHLFNAYAKYINIRYHRHGSLFERPFNRKRIDNEKYFKNLVIYIHNNPVQHEFVENAFDYPWSSYLTCISQKQTRLQRNNVMEWFDDLPNFKCIHKNKIDDVAIDRWLGI